MEWYGDAPATEYTLHDFNIRRPIEPEKRIEKVLSLSDIQDEYGIPIYSSATNLVTTAFIAVNGNKEILKMNKLITLGLASLATAQERSLQIDITPGEQIDFPTIGSDSFISTGFLQEVMITEVDLADNEHKELWLEV